MTEPTYDFACRHVLVTGGTRGLGRTLAAAFHRAGARVTVTGTQSLTSAYDASLSTYAYERLELTDHDSIVRVAQAVGPLDILVNAAGARIPTSLDVHDREFVSQAIRLGLVGPSHLANRLRYRLGESQMRGGGVVINTHSLRRWLEISHGAAAAQAEMLSMTSRLGASWARTGVRVNGVASTMAVAHAIAAAGGDRPELRSAPHPAPPAAVGHPPGRRPGGAVPGQLRRGVHHRPDPDGQRQRPRRGAPQPLTN